MVATIAAHARWANTEDRTAATENARRAAYDRFEKKVDPEGKLPLDIRAKRAASARKSFYQQMALRSAQARRARGVAA